jgi:glutamyl-tRNA reductase
MKLLITGVSHKTAPVEIESACFFRHRAASGLGAAEVTGEACRKRHSSTCNRVEVVVTSDDGVDLQGLVGAFLAETRQASIASLGPCLYHHEGREAIHHSSA